MLSIKKLLTKILNKIGNTSMGTTATSITGAIAEHESDISDLNSKIVKNNYSTGTRYASIQSANAIKVGNVVFLSADVNITSDRTDLASIPLVMLSELIPSITGDEQYVPGVVNIRRSGVWESWTSHVCIKKYPNGNYYLEEKVTNTLNNGDKVCFFVVFTTV